MRHHSPARAKVARRAPWLTTDARPALQAAPARRSGMIRLRAPPPLPRARATRRAHAHLADRHAAGWCTDDGGQEGRWCATIHINRFVGRSGPARVSLIVRYLSAAFLPGRVQAPRRRCRRRRRACQCSLLSCPSISAPSSTSSSSSLPPSFVAVPPSAPLAWHSKARRQAGWPSRQRSLTCVLDPQNNPMFRSADSTGRFAFLNLGDHRRGDSGRDGLLPGACNASKPMQMRSCSVRRSGD
jgi:hypothetical protein